MPRMNLPNVLMVLVTLLAIVTGCGGPKTSPYLADCGTISRGDVQRGYHSSGLTAQHLQRIYIEPIDAKRVEGGPWRTLAEDHLGYAIGQSLRKARGFGVTDSPTNCTSRLQVVVIDLDPGSQAWRLVGGGGEARLTIEGKWLDPATNKPLACFMDSSAETGASNFNDLRADASEKQIRGLFTHLGKHIHEQVTLDLKHGRR